MKLKRTEGMTNSTESILQKLMISQPRLPRYDSLLDPTQPRFIPRPVHPFIEQIDKTKKIQEDQKLERSLTELKKVISIYFGCFIVLVK